MSLIGLGGAQTDWYIRRLALGLIYLKAGKCFSHAHSHTTAC